MCIRYTDFINDEDKVRSILSEFTNYVKKTVKKCFEDFETLVLWLANTLCLLHSMKQYSGEEVFKKYNSPKQNEQCLKNFDLSQYRQLLADIAVWIYQCLIRNLEEKVQPLIVPAILEHEELPGISGNKPSGLRGRSTSVSSPISPTVKPTTSLLQELSSHFKVSNYYVSTLIKNIEIILMQKYPLQLLKFYGVDQEVISQVFKQIFYFICASSLNNLLLRKELCHWAKGLQIRHNLSNFEMWTREKQLDVSIVNRFFYISLLIASIFLGKRHTRNTPTNHTSSTVTPSKKD